MASLIEQVILTCSSIEQNSNKVWVGELYDNGDVITRWGRIRGDLSNDFSSLDFKEFPNAGESFLRKKERDKLRPKKDKECYTRVPTVRNSGTATVVQPAISNLQSVAREQLAKSNPVLTQLIDRLVKANVHNIVSQTSITYNSVTGLFMTPLGAVTKQGIDDARTLLVSVKKAMIDKVTKELPKLTSQYLRIIPHDFGMRRLSVDLVFPDLDAVEKESDILDSLESTLEAMAKQPEPKKETKVSTPNKVFEVDIEPLTDARETRRLEDYYHKSMKSMHGYGGVKIRNIYLVVIHSMNRAFNAKIGNVVQCWHGTSQANLLSILKSGLRTSPPSTAYIAGKMFGNGLYFSQTSSKSLGYTFGRWGGSKGESGWLFSCDVAMGKAYYPTTYGLSRIPDGYDSCWALPNKTGLMNDELIVYANDRVNIRYLLEVS